MVVYEYYRHESQQLCSKMEIILPLNINAWILWFIQSLNKYYCWNARKIRKKHLLSHGPPAMEENEFGWRGSYDETNINHCDDIWQVTMNFLCCFYELKRFETYVSKKFYIKTPQSKHSMLIWLQRKELHIIWTKLIILFSFNSIVHLKATMKGLRSI